MIASSDLETTARSSIGNYSQEDCGALIGKDDSQQSDAPVERTHPFMKRLAARANERENITVLEIVAGRKSSYRETTLLDLYTQVVTEAKEIDSEFLRKKPEPFSEVSKTGEIASGLGQAHGAGVFLRRRDLRWLESSSEQEPTILVRRHVALIVFDPIRALVMCRKLILIVPSGADSLLEILEQNMSEWLPEESVQVTDVDIHIPFELHAYDALFTAVKVFQSNQQERIKNASNKALAQTRKKGSLLPLRLQEDLRELKTTASEMAGTVDLYRRAINEMIMNDDHMALMNLSQLAKNPSLYRIPLCPKILSAHEEIEDLLQTYAMDFDSLSTKLKFLRDRIQNAEDLASLRLDTSRNELLVANTAFALLACCIAVGAYIAGIFGMNLDNTITIQPKSGSFAAVWSGSTAAIVVMFVVVYGYLEWAGILPQRVEIQK